MEEPLQHQATTQCIGLPTTRARGHRHDGPKANHALTFNLDHSSGAAQIRAGKNNRDRGYLREIYKNLFTHLRELKESIENGKLKQWDSYPKVGDKYAPLITSLEQDGMINALPDRLAKELLETEKATLFNNWQWKKMIEDRVSTEIRGIFLDSIDGDGKSKSGVPYRPMRLSKIMVLKDEEFRKLLSGLDDGEIGLGLELKLEGNRTDMLHAYSDSLKSGSLSELAQKIRKESLSTDEAKGLAEIHHQKIKELDSLMDKVAKRIKDPHPFWSSVKQALRDPFG